MKITGIKGYHLALPTNQTAAFREVDPFTKGIYRREENVQAARNTRTYLIEIQTDEGITGYGEVESLYGARGAVARAGENLIGADPFDVQHNIYHRILGEGKDLKYPGLPLQKEHMALEFAMWDIIGKNTSVPVYQVLGGKVRRRQAISCIIDEKPIDECLKEIDAAVKSGILTVKLMIGSNDTRDVELVKQVREHFGWDLILRVDASGAYGDVTDAVRILKQIEPYNLQYAEGFLTRKDATSYRRLREMTGVCMCDKLSGSNTLTTHEALTKLTDFVVQDAVDVLSVDPSTAGGLYGFTQIASFCEGAGIEVVTHHAMGGLSQSTWLTAAGTSFSASYAQDIQPGIISGDIVKKPLIHEDGYMVIPDGNGFGVEIDWDNVKKYCIDTESAGTLEE